MPAINLLCCTIQSYTIRTNYSPGFMNICYTILILLLNNICDPMEDACWLFLILNTYCRELFNIFIV